MPHFFRCPACGIQLPRAVERCPECDAAFEGVVCRACGHTGPAATFRVGVCPKCKAPLKQPSAIGCLGLLLVALGAVGYGLWG